jgi:hypothetical protein
VTAKAQDQTITYRPTGNAGNTTLATTANVSIKLPATDNTTKVIIKLKFPLTGATGVAK